MTAAEDRVAIGRIVRPHGVRGAVKVEPLTDFPERFRSLSRVFLEDGAEASLIVEGVAFDPKGRVLLQFQGVETREAAEALRGAFLLLPASELVPLPADHFYMHELLDCEVEDEGGRTIGRVRTIMRTGSNEVLVVQAPDGGEELIPFIHDVVQQCDPGARKIIIRVIPGLLRQT